MGFYITYHACLFEVEIGTMVSLDQALTAVEGSYHEHSKGKHVAGKTAYGFVLYFRCCQGESMG